MEVGVQPLLRQLRRPLPPLLLFDKSEIIGVEVARLPQSRPHPLGNVPHKEVKEKKRSDGTLQNAGLMPTCSETSPLEETKSALSKR